MNWSFNHWKAKFLEDKNLRRLVIIGLLARLFVFFVFYPEASVFPDSSGFRHLAAKMATFSLEGYIGKRSPGYPLLILAGFGKYKLVVMYQFIIGVVCSLFWYKTLIHFRFSKKQSFYITFFMQTFLGVFFFETAILVESLALCLMAMVVYMVTQPNYGQNKSYQQELLLSVLLGILVLVKPFFAYLPFLIYGLFTLKNFSLKNIFNKKLLLLIFPLLVYFGWSYVNKINTGYFVSTTYLGLNLSQNCVYFAEKAPEEYQWIAKPYAKYRDKTIKEERDVAMSIWNAYGEGKVFEKYGLTFPQLTHELGKYAKATIMANPKAYAKQVLYRSWWDFWEPTVYWHSDQFRFKWAKKLFVQIWQIQKVVLYAFNIIFGILAIGVGFYSIYKRKIGMVFILCCWVIVPSFLQAMVTYGTNSQYSYPFEFIILFVILLFLKEQGIMTRLNKIREN